MHCMCRKTQPGKNTASAKNTIRCHQIHGCRSAGIHNNRRLSFRHDATGSEDIQQAIDSDSFRIVHICYDRNLLTASDHYGHAVFQWPLPQQFISRFRLAAGNHGSCRHNAIKAFPPCLKLAGEIVGLAQNGGRNIDRDHATQRLRLEQSELGASVSDING